MTRHMDARRLFGALTLAFALALGLAACGNESPFQLQDDASKVFWTLTTDEHALTLAVGQTQQLAATPRTASGAVVTSDDAPTFQSTDSSKVTVDANGVVRGVGVTSSTYVIAAMTVGEITNVDTVLVVVTALPRTIKTFSIQPTLPGGATVSLNSYKSLAATVLDSANASVFGLAVKYTTSDTAIATISGGYLVAHAKGSVVVTATTKSYGVSKRDSVVYTVTNPASGSFAMYGSLYPTLGALYPATVIVGVNATVTWYNYSGAVSGITFDNGGTGIPGGNIAPLALYASASRTFPTAGTYTFKDSAGNSGTLIVLPD